MMTLIVLVLQDLLGILLIKEIDPMPLKVIK